MHKIKDRGVPSGDDAARGAHTGFENEGSKRRGQKGRGKEGGQGRELRFLQTKNGRNKGIDGGADIVPFTTSSKIADVPRRKTQFN
jgi:hypothetical protein